MLLPLHKKVRTLLVPTHGALTHASLHRYHRHEKQAWRTYRHAVPVDPLPRWTRIKHCGTKRLGSPGGYPQHYCSAQPQQQSYACSFLETQTYLCSMHRARFQRCAALLAHCRPGSTCMPDSKLLPSAVVQSARCSCPAAAAATNNTHLKAMALRTK